MSSGAKRSRDISPRTCRSGPSQADVSRQPPAPARLTRRNQAIRPSQVPLASVPQIGFVLRSLLSSIIYRNSLFSKHFALISPPAKLALFCTIALPQRTAAPPARVHSRARGPNWVRFVHLTLGPRPRGPRPTRLRRELGSFCTFRRGTPTSRPKLGSFCTFGSWQVASARSAAARQARPTSSATARNWVRFAHQPSGRAELGSFCTTAFGGDPRAEGRGRTARPRRPNWVRFARLSPVPAGGVFQSAIHNHQSAILGPRPPNWLRFAHFTPRPSHARQRPLPTYPSPSKFGFVLHDLLRQPPPAGTNWVRFAHQRLASARYPTYHLPPATRRRPLASQSLLTSL
jgi:hypothetical protein